MTAPSPSGVVDAHVAVGVESPFVHADPERLIRDLDGAGIGVAVLGPIGRWAVVDNGRCNEVLAEWVDRYPERLEAYATVNPWYGDAGVEMLRRAFDTGLCGLKLIPAQQGFPLLSPLLDAVLAVVAEYQKAVYVVTGVPVVSEPLQLAELALRHPSITFVMGRSGRTDFSLDVEPALQIAQNIVAETAYNGPSLIKDLVATFGAERVLFTTDQPFNDSQLELGRLARTELDGHDRTAVMHDTAVRVLGLQRSSAVDVAGRVR